MDNRWEVLQSRTYAYADANGKILGMVEYSLVYSHWRASCGDTLLGRYVTVEDAKRAVEVATQAPTLMPITSVLPT